MHFFKALNQSLHRWFESSPNTLVEKGIRAQKKFNASDDRTDYQAQYSLNKAAVLFCKAEQLYRERDDDASLVHVLFCLGNVDWELYVSAGKSRERLDRAILSYEAALTASKNTSCKPSNYIDLLTNTAYAYKERFEQWHARSDIDKSIELYIKARVCTSYASPEYIEIVQIIGSIYWKLYRSHTCADAKADSEMDQASTYFLHAYTVCPKENKSAKADCAYTLACIAYTRFQKQESPNMAEYLSLTVSFYRSAIEFMSSAHPYYHQALQAISLILWYRYNGEHQEQDLRDAQRFATLALPYSSANAEEKRNLEDIIDFRSNSPLTILDSTYHTVLDAQYGDSVSTSPMGLSDTGAKETAPSMSPACSVAPGYDV